MKVVRIILMIINAVAALGLILTTLAGSVAPSNMILPSLMAYAFVSMLALNVVFTLMWLLMKRWAFLISAAAIAVRWPIVCMYLQVGGDTQVPARAVHEQMLSLMTYNVHQFRGPGLDYNPSDSIAREFLDLVRREQPDVLCMQEYAAVKKVNITDSLSVQGYNHYYGSHAARSGVPYGTVVFLIVMHISNIVRLSKGEEKTLSLGQRTLADRKKPVEYPASYAAAEDAPTVAEAAEAETAAAQDAETIKDTEDPEKTVKDEADIEEEITDSDNEDAASGFTEISIADKPLTDEELSELGADAQVFEDLESGESPIAADATQEPSLVGAQTQEAIRPEPEPIDYYAGVEVPDLGDEACKIAVIGNGSFGTAMANLLAYSGHDVTLYGRNIKAMKLLESRRINDHYLPYVILSDRIKYTSDLKEAVLGKSIVVFAVPTQKFRQVSSACAEYLEDGVIAVNLAKGIEQKTLLRLSEIAAETIPGATYVALSGPSHAEEIVRNFPASVVVCSKNKAAAEYVQDVFMTDKFRIYTQDDMIGVEIAGAVKNVIAITTGIMQELHL